MMQANKKPPTASFVLEGDNLKHFGAVKEHMMTMLPGTDPSNIEVVRYMGYLAAQGVPPLSGAEDRREYGIC